ncbi:transcriptional regulator, LysR family [Roseivivax lentus]|uniref:Transcriptional regulator, LysR family n=1 Tax=Roseivivax lentus TaxID=633194 RepID=A0A1N7N9M0_9RHOB|nr:transcriptional regulator, LysR family [Roseivivax lentus]
MLKLDYDAIVALAAVVREGRFDLAANSLNVTQSAISQRIKQLEDKVGSVLIVRGRPCVPTEAGLHLCRYAEQVELLQHELNDRMNALAGTAGTVAAQIRISVNNDSLATWFPHVIKRAKNELGIRFDIFPDDQEHTETRLKTGEALAVVTAIETPVQGCRRVSLGAMDYIAVASPEFFEENFPDGVSLKSLENTACLAFDRKDTIQDQWMMNCFGETVRVLTHMVPSYEGYVACCVNGTAWGLVPSVAARAYIERGELVELSPENAVRVSLHWQTSTQSSEILRRLGDLVLEVAKEYLSPDMYREE